MCRRCILLGWLARPECRQQVRCSLMVAAVWCGKLAFQLHVALELPHWESIALFE